MYILDLHCHILPGLDDGAFHDEESLQMARLAAANHTQGIVCTPHNAPKGVYPLRKLLETFHHLCTLLRSQNIPLKLFLGQEIFLADDYRDTIAALKKGYLLTINRSVYPLVEFDPHENVMSVRRKIAALCAEGFLPIIAHPERYRFLQEDYDAAPRLKELGALLQVNKGSLNTAFGFSAERTAKHLLDARLADFIASDAHSPYMRTTALRDTHEWLSERYSMDYANLLLHHNPQSVLRNVPVDPSSY